MVRVQSDDLSNGWIKLTLNGYEGLSNASNDETCCQVCSNDTPLALEMSGVLN